MEKKYLHEFTKPEIEDINAKLDVGLMKDLNYEIEQHPG